MNSLLRDVRYGARLLARSRWFAAIGIASLAIGLGSATAMFSVLNGALFRPLPGHDTGDVHTIHTSGRDGGRYGGTSFADFRSFTSVPGLFAAACATENVRANLASGAATHALAGAVTNGGCFDVIRLRPHLGRLLNRSDDDPGGTPGIVIGHALWRRAFNRDAAIVGRAVLVNGAPAVIVGVMEPGFAGLSLDGGADFWAPSAMAPALLPAGALSARGDRRFHVYVRLEDGVTTALAAERLAVVAADLQREDPEAWTDARGSTRTIAIERELDSRFANGGGIFELAALALAGIAGVVAMACLNLATMALARGAARTRELNIRLALGASRARLLRQLATESLLVSLGGAVGGSLVVAVALKLFDAYKPTEVPAFNIALDWRVAVFTTFLALVAPVLFGLAPGAHALRLAIAEGLRARPPLMRRRYLRVGSRELLLGVQVTASFALLVMAAVFARSLTSTGPDAKATPAANVIVVPVDLNTAAETDADAHAIAERVLEAVAGVPDIDRSTIAAIVPLTGSFIGIRGRISDDPETPLVSFDGNVVAPGYFDLAGIPRRAGRDFDSGDRRQTPGVAIVSESLARRLWHGTAVLGRSIRLDAGPREVVGVVADVPYRSTSDVDQPVLYLPLAQSARDRFVVHARVRNHGAAGAAIDRAVRVIDARIIVGTGMPLDRFLDQARTPGRVAQGLSTAAGLLQLGLVLMATWGLVAYAVERRTTEIAIRRALGATAGGILRLVMRPTLVLLVLGAAAGCAVGVAVVTALHASFTGLAPIDLRVVVPVATPVAAVVVAAAWLPARRAASVEPASALKET